MHILSTSHNQLWNLSAAEESEDFRLILLKLDQFLGLPELPVL